MVSVVKGAVVSRFSISGAFLRLLLATAGFDGALFFLHSRVAQRGGGLNSSAARSEHEVSEIIDGISEHEVSWEKSPVAVEHMPSSYPSRLWACDCQNTEKQMRQLAVIPPMLFDAEQQRIKFINMNGLMDDPMKVYKDRQVMNMWSEQEKETFREK